MVFSSQREVASEITSEDIDFEIKAKYLPVTFTSFLHASVGE